MLVHPVVFRRKRIIQAWLKRSRLGINRIYHLRRDSGRRNKTTSERIRIATVYVDVVIPVRNDAVFESIKTPKTPDSRLNAAKRRVILPPGSLDRWLVRRLTPGPVTERH